MTLTDQHYKLRYGLLHGFGGLSLAIYFILAFQFEHAGGSRDIQQFLGLFAILFGVYFLAIAVLLLRREPARAPLVILIWAALFRFVLLGAGLPPDSWHQDVSADLRSERVAYRSFLLYDNDVWRYLWDGHVFAGGFNPYLRSPAELEALADEEDPRALALFESELWQDIFDRVSYETYGTVYPPLAQWLFRLLHSILPGSVLAWKVVIAGLDFATCCLLVALLRRYRRPALAMIYAWNPLALKELAGSGHLDALMIFFLVLSIYWLDRGRPIGGLIAYGLAVLAKVTPILLLGLYLRRTRPTQWPILAAVLAAGYLPFLSALETLARNLLQFAREWVFNPGPWLLLRWLGEQLGLDGRSFASGLSLLLTLTLIVWVVARDDGSDERLITGSFWILGGFLLTRAAVMPWYLLWVLPLAALLVGSRKAADTAAARHEPCPEVWAWLVLTALSLLSYQIYVDQIEHRWWLWVEYLVFFSILGWGFLTYPGRRSQEPAITP